MNEGSEAGFYLAFQSMVTEAVNQALQGNLPAQEEKQGSRPPATRQEAAAFLGLSLPSIDKLVKSNQLKAFKIGRSVRITWDSLEAFISGAAE